MCTTHNPGEKQAFLIIKKKKNKNKQKKQNSSSWLLSQWEALTTPDEHGTHGHGPEGPEEQSWRQKAYEMCVS